MKYSESMELLRNTPVFWSRLGIGYDPPVKDDEGRWLLFSRDFDRYRYLHKSFYDIGVKVHSSVLPNGWMGVDEYDYSDVDRVLDAIMDIGDDFCYLPRVKVTVPIDWCRENPKDVLVYFDGPRDEEGIRSTVDTLKQDILGYDCEAYNANGSSISYDRPNVGGIIGMQSFSSQKWLEDAGNALKKLIEHIKTKPYADRIIGFHIAYGNCGETAMSGSWNREARRHGDYGIHASENFENYSRDNCGIAYEVPNAELMYGEKSDIAGFFRTGYPECECYSKFLSEANIKACEHFCRIVKEADSDYVTGIFYGYILGQPNCSNSGHLAIDKAIESKYIDFLASPKGYYKCGPFGPGLEQAPCNSISRKMLYIDEIDNLTHLHFRKTDPEKAQNFEETKTVLLRELSKNLAFNQGYWWMDLGEGCFDSDEVMSFVSDMNVLAQKVNSKKNTNVCEVLVVIDEESMHYATPSFTYHERFIKEFASNIKMCGAPVMIARKSDLYDMELSGFKAVFFLNCFKTDSKLEDIIHNGFSKETVFVWNYAAGFLGTEHGTDGVKSLTGFNIEDYDGDAAGLNGGDEIDFPLICISENSGIEVIKRYDDGKAMIASSVDARERKNILCAFPMLNLDDIYDIIHSAGAYMPAVKHCTVYANSAFVAFFANEDVRFEFDIGENTAYDAFGDESFSGKLDIELKRGRHRFFLMKR